MGTEKRINDIDKYGGRKLEEVEGEKNSKRKEVGKEVDT